MPAPPTPADALAAPVSSFSECWLEASCCSTTVMPVKLLIRHHGDRPVGSIVARLRCSKCGATPKAVYLNETRRAILPVAIRVTQA